MSAERTRKKRRKGVRRGWGVLSAWYRRVRKEKKEEENKKRKVDSGDCSRS